MNTAVVITTYNSPDWLEKVLWGYSVQTEKNFQVIIADDGSSEETRQLIDRMREETGLKIEHIWHEDDGFRKTIILNKAIVSTDADYLIISDGDCIPRNDFVATHLAFAEPGYFLSGGYFKLPMSISKAITREDITSGRFADLKWLRAQGLKSSAKTWKLRSKGWVSRLSDALTPTKPTWNGMNSSTWKSDILAVNGFNEQMQYGGLDRELGERLVNYGLKSKQIRHSAVCLHLDHSRPYSRPEILAKNKAIRKDVVENKIKWTPYGIQKSEEAKATAEAKPENNG